MYFYTSENHEEFCILGCDAVLSGLFSNISEESYASFFMVEECHEDGGSAFLRDVSEYLTNCIASHPRREWSSKSRLGEPRVILYVKSLCVRRILFSGFVRLPLKAKNVLVTRFPRILQLIQIIQNLLRFS
jgi:hypothetical protein